ncbi:probable beta-d-xylosidase 7 [Phtheirospermum japonicum]|uniref:Probable beta-d-xylosidase 7 n=1 Tax=Phtheirospermum japonicum TaxID=374723 RepID=A0A830B3R1_9LAMI|nr:probable beta-d-xylosidase 7 [Phtheirospermum japonicum]
MRTTLLTLLATTLLLSTAVSANEPPFSCGPQTTKSFKFCKTTLPIHERVDDLISRLTLDEKISQLVSTSPAIPRLGIAAYEWWSEALHGVSGYGRGISFSGTITKVTSFPQVILSASTFDCQLWYHIGQAIGKETRAVYNVGQAKGMTFWAPNINIYRDPRWGRGPETPGEDPVMAGKYAVAFVRGIQGNGSQLLQASACCKHFTANDLDHWKGVSRLDFDAKVTKQDLADTYQPPFKSCIGEGRASGIMCAYNRVNGVPNCADYNLLTKTARGEWGFDGYITSDCDGVSIIHDVQKYAPLPEDAVAYVLKAGMDLNCGTYLQTYTKSAINQKKVSESEVDRALRNLLAVRMRLGLFNGNPKQQPFGDIGPDQVCTKEHQQLALDAARNGIVLLKNPNKLLPLPKSTPSLAVIGPNANNAYALLGNYEGPPCKSLEIYTVLKGYVKDAFYHSGCNAVNCTSAAIGDAVETAKRAEHVVLVMGLDQSQETEDRDREVLTLPGQQEELVRAVAAASKKPVVLVLVCGGPVDVSFAKDEPKIGSILWAGYPGEAGGIALAEIIFGEHNPGGKLPVTWYPKEFINVPMTDMRMRPDPSSGYPGRTYRFYQGKKVFEFGYGLSYSKYSYEFLPSTPNTINLKRSILSSQATDVSEIGAGVCESLKFSTRVGVENTGDMAGKHPVLLFVRPGDGVLVKQLVAFESVNLNVGERVEVEFVLNPCEHLSSANEDGVMVIEKGYRHLLVEDKEYTINIIL